MRTSILIALLLLPALAMAQEAELDDQLRENPDDVELLLERAENMLAEGRFDEALVDCEHAATLAPNDPAIALTRGRIHLAMGELERAEGFFTKNLKHAPTIEVLLLRGGIREETNRSREALADYDAARKLAAQLSKQEKLDLLQLIDIEEARARVLESLKRKKQAHAAREHAKHLRSLVKPDRDPSAI
jgi:tetratricopeptide (TPR) repeat protein